MSFLAPMFMVAAGIAAAAVVAIHFIVTREPRTVPLPTARFAPVRPVRASARRLRLQDVLLMLLRVLLILAFGAALAQPIFDPPKRDLARIVLVDRSRAVADPQEVSDSAMAIVQDGDAIVLYDSAAVAVRANVSDSLVNLATNASRGALSPALIAALRTASDMRERADAFELAVISPLPNEQFDAATDSIRALWPGTVRLVRVAARAGAGQESAPAFDGDAADPLRFALPGTGRDTAGAAARITRGTPTAEDSAWAAAAPRALVHWPALPGEADGEAQAVAAGWETRAQPDSVGAVTSGATVVVAPFERTARYTGDTLGARVIARWMDGEPAAVEVAHGSGCVRTVAINIPVAGDLVLEPRFRRLAGELTGPCSGNGEMPPADSVRVAAFAGDSVGNVLASVIPGVEVVRSPLVPWLLAAALVFGILSMLLQRRTARSAVSLDGGAAE